MRLNDLNQYLTEFLEPARFNDYCPNGLQVEGRRDIKKIVTGVTACQVLLEQAQAAKADAILVHHGYFWKGESAVVTGIKKKRLKFLLAHDLSLFAYHLPLDAHPELGNNVMLGRVLGLPISGWLDSQQMLAQAILPETQTLQQIAQLISTKLGREVQVIGELDKPVKSVAWCTGAAQSYIEQAIAKGVDVFVSGEISEPTVHLARESGTAYIAAGHHATERYGVRALGMHLSERFDLSHEFIDVDNPV